ncbi:MAG TPA: hypothetical protein VMU02_03315 [bacterium]|nr:hypothetical protein [bacterium]
MKASSGGTQGWRADGPESGFAAEGEVAGDKVAGDDVAAGGVAVDEVAGAGACEVLDWAGSGAPVWAAASSKPLRPAQHRRAKTARLTATGKRHNIPFDIVISLAQTSDFGTAVWFARFCFAGTLDK